MFTPKRHGIRRRGIVGGAAGLVATCVGAGRARSQALSPAGHNQASAEVIEVRPGLQAGLSGGRADDSLILQAFLYALATARARGRMRGQFGLGRRLEWPASLCSLIDAEGAEFVGLPGAEGGLMRNAGSGFFFGATFHCQGANANGPAYLHDGDGRVEGLTVLESGNAGIQVGGGGKIAHCVVRDHVAGNYSGGILVRTRKALLVEDCRISDVGGNGIFVSAQNLPSSEEGLFISPKTLRKNIIERVKSRPGDTGQTGNGIDVFLDEKVQISNNSISSTGFSGVRLASALRVDVQSNQISDCGDMNAVFAEFQHHNIRVSSNHVNGDIVCTNEISDGADGSSIEGNQLTNGFIYAESNVRIAQNIQIFDDHLSRRPNLFNQMRGAGRLAPDYPQADVAVLLGAAGRCENCRVEGHRLIDRRMSQVPVRGVIGVLSSPTGVPAVHYADLRFGNIDGGGVEPVIATDHQGRAQARTVVRRRATSNLTVSVSLTPQTWLDAYTLAFQTPSTYTVAADRRGSIGHGSLGVPFLDPHGHLGPVTIFGVASPGEVVRFHFELQPFHVGQHSL